MYKIRFNLGRGENYLKWQVKYNNSNVEYYSPEHYTLIMTKCILKNNRKTAEKIYLGKNKTVCAWINCQQLIIRYDYQMPESKNYTFLLSYNPKKKPYWTSDFGYDLDNTSFEYLYTVGRNIYCEVVNP